MKLCSILASRQSPAPKTMISNTDNHVIATPFLDQLDAAEKLDAGVFLIGQFLSQEQSMQSFQNLNDGMPWELKPTLYGGKLSQHAYLHIRNKKGAKRAQKSTGLAHLEELSAKIEKDFDGKVSEVYCNRFMDPDHHIPYHTDNFGKNIIVLSLGSSRTVNFRNKKNKQVTKVRPKSGGLYFMPLRVNDSYEHCVCAASEKDLASGENTRLSFVFFLETPKYAKEYKISTFDKVGGYMEGILSG